MINLILISFLEPHMLYLSSDGIPVRIIIIPDISISISLDTAKDIVEIRIKFKLLICKTQIYGSVIRWNRMT